MTDRYTKALLSVIVVASTLLLTSCSNPDTSGGVTVTMSRDNGSEFPNGSCEGEREFTDELNTGCGWMYAHKKRYYIQPYADLISAYLYRANLSGASLSDANLSHANLSGADLSGVIANSRTTCPNGINWRTAGNDCGF